MEPNNIFFTCRSCAEKLYKNKGNLDPPRGSFAKLGFKDGKKVEHMWVEVTRNDNGDCEGILDNEPMNVENVKYGDIIRFRKEEVEDLMKGT